MVHWGGRLLLLLRQRLLGAQRGARVGDGFALPAATAHALLSPALLLCGDGGG